MTKTTLLLRTTLPDLRLESQSRAGSVGSSGKLTAVSKILGTGLVNVSSAILVIPNCIRFWHCRTNLEVKQNRNLLVEPLASQHTGNVQVVEHRLFFKRHIGKLLPFVVVIMEAVFIVEELYIFFTHGRDADFINLDVE